MIRVLEAQAVIPAIPVETPAAGIKPRVMAVREMAAAPAEMAKTGIRAIPAATTTAARARSFGGVKISAGITNGWGDSPFYKQYALRIENTGTKELSGWKLVLTFSDRIELESGWCGHFSVSGRKLIITPESYNSHITAGGCVENIGFIVKGSKAPEMVEIAWR